MKKLATIVGLLVMSTISFANTTQITLDKNSQALKSLGSAFKSQRIIQPDQNDITIVYGGEDVSQHGPVKTESTLT